MTRKLDITLTVELGDEWGDDLGEQLLKDLASHYSDLGHLADEQTIIDGTIMTDDGYYMSGKNFAKD